MENEIKCLQAGIDFRRRKIRESNDIIELGSKVVAQIEKYRIIKLQSEIARLERALHELSGQFSLVA